MVLFAGRLGFARTLQDVGGDGVKVVPVLGIVDHHIRRRRRRKRKVDADHVLHFPGQRWRVKVLGVAPVGDFHRHLDVDLEVLGKHFSVPGPQVLERRNRTADGVDALAIEPRAQVAVVAGNDAPAFLRIRIAAVRFQDIAYFVAVDDDCVRFLGSPEIANVASQGCLPGRRKSGKPDDQERVSFPAQS